MQFLLSEGAVPQKILVVDDDARLQKLLARYLNEQGFATSTASDALEMHRLIQRNVYQLYILDINMPGEDGLQICQRLRASGDKTPIIMLTARGEDVDRIQGLELGADDYLAKPFNPRELVARINAVLRRQGARHGSALSLDLFQYTFGQYHLDAEAGRLFFNGAPVALAHHEFALLKTLIQNAGEPLSRTQLSERIYGYEREADQRGIDMMVSRLRKHLSLDPTVTDCIQTVRGVGYRFVAP